MTIEQLYAKWEDPCWVFPFGIEIDGKVHPVYGLKWAYDDCFEVIVGGLDFSITALAEEELVRIENRKAKKEMEL